MEYLRQIEIKETYDVLVCGGGCAGFCAAVAAARRGAKTGLVEKNGMLGGIMTAGGNPPIALFYAGDRQVIRGIGWEFVTRLSAMGFARIPVFQKGVRHSAQAVEINVPVAAYLLDTMCQEAGVALHLMSAVVDVEVRREGYCVIAAGKGGLYGLMAKVLVDASGDGDACALVGAEYEIGGENGDLQPGTLGFYADVPSDVEYPLDRLAVLFRQSVERGETEKRDLWSSDHPGPIFRDHGCNAGHVPIDRHYEDRLTEIQIEGRKSVYRLAAWVKNRVPEGDRVNFAAISPEVGLRETRRILCDESITAQAYVSGKEYADAICYSYYPIDLHQDGSQTLHNIFLEDGVVPQIPFGALLVKGFDNLLVAGRCISGDRLAQSAFRVKASCMATGQAVGTAAALAVHGSGSVRDVPRERIRQTLASDGAIVPGLAGCGVGEIQP